MERNFVPYELAVKLKELGFDEPCLACYLDSVFVIKLQSQNSEFEYFNNTTFSFNEKSFSAPLWQQAFDWFRETKNLFSIVNWYRVNGNPDREFLYYIDVFEVGSETKNGFETYEVARTACLEKLIELTPIQHG